jgi:hypothetical protein
MLFGPRQAVLVTCIFRQFSINRRLTSRLSF